MCAGFEDSRVMVWSLTPKPLPLDREDLALTASQIPVEGDNPENVRQRLSYLNIHINITTVYAQRQTSCYISSVMTCGFADIGSNFVVRSSLMTQLKPVLNQWYDVNRAWLCLSRSKITAAVFYVNLI